MKIKNKKIKFLLYGLLLMIPTIVFAESSNEMSFVEAVFAHLFLTMFSYVTVLTPLSQIIKSDVEERKSCCKTLFLIRIVILIVLISFSPIISFFVDFVSIFVGGFILIPMATRKDNTNKELLRANIIDEPMRCTKCNAEIKAGDVFCISCGEKVESTTVVNTNSTEVFTCPKCKRKLPPGNHFCIHCGQSIEVSEAIINKTDLKCAKCQSVIKPTDVFCTNCGSKVSYISTVKNFSEYAQAHAGNSINVYELPYYNMTEDQMLTTMIESEITKSGEKNSVSIAALEKKKSIFALVYAVIVFICISLLFFHTKTVAIIAVFGIASFIYFNNVRKYNIVQYLKKEIKSRPDEKINYIVSSVISGKIDNSFFKIVRIAILVVAVIIPLFIFRAPHVIYEEQSDGYVIRFYTVGLLENDKVLEIPEKYKGKPVVGIRGDVFANVKTIEEVILPDTIKEIRGGAFMNAISLEKINLPEGIPEIKGSTFEGCSSLKEITIPDSVTRIGGSAFRDNTSLAKVVISENSKLEEIGSSAFRNCYKLKEITLPKNVNINERAFKGNTTTVREYTNNYVSSSADSSGSTSSGAITSTKDVYEYNRFLYLTLGERQLVNAYRTNAVTQDYYIELIKVEESRTDDYTYVLNISNASGGSHSFLLFEGQNTYVDNEYDIVVECVNSYYFTAYNESIGVNIYFN
ncbi:MAG: leucine-rich repeat protein [Candidatus Coprovivens sp.]